MRTNKLRDQITVRTYSEKFIVLVVDQNQTQKVVHTYYEIEKRRLAKNFENSLDCL